MKEWVLSVCGTVILTGIALSILPQGKLGKIIKNIFSVMCIAVFIRPILTINTLESDYNLFFNEMNLNLDNDYLDYDAFLKGENLKKSIISLLKDDNCDVSEVNLDLLYEDEVLSAKSVFIRLDKSYFQSGKDSNHIIDRVYEYLSNKIKIDKNNIKISE